MYVRRRKQFSPCALGLNKRLSSPSRSLQSVRKGISVYSAYWHTRADYSRPLFFSFIIPCFFFLHPGMYVYLQRTCPFVCAAAIWCSHHVRTRYASYFARSIRDETHNVICTLPHLGILLFFFSFEHFSSGFLLRSRTRYASTWFAFLDSSS